MKHVSFALLLLFVARACAQQTELRVWLMPGECAAFHVPLAEGDQRFQLVPSNQATVRVAGVVTGCLRTNGDGSCAHLADASAAACSTAVQSDLASALEGELLAVPAGAEGFVYVSNTGKRPVLADLLAVVQPIGQAAAAEATAVGSYRRSLLRSARSENSAAVTAAIAADAATALRRRPRRALLQTDSSSPATTDVLAGGSPTPSPTPAPSSSDSDSPATRDVLAGQSGNSTTPTSSPTSSTDSQNLIDRAVDRFDDPTVRKWVKIAIIVLIVLVCLSILSCLFCILRCLCWPCCCAARGFK